VTLQDVSYDGELSSDGWLTNGLGTLYDGRLGTEDFRADSGSWVGWKRSETGLVPGVEQPVVRFSFHFQTTGNLSAILIHMSNKFSEGIQVSFSFPSNTLLLPINQLKTSLSMIPMDSFSPLPSHFLSSHTIHFFTAFLIIKKKDLLVKRQERA
jgi:hypothetical protein